MVNDLDIDVAVIGAGPSGARAAAVLAAAGHRVRLFERDTQPGIPLHCTGIVSKECFDMYALPEDLILHEIQSFILRSPKGKGALVNRDNVQAYVLDRLKLDLHLVNLAVEAGAELFTSSEVTDLKWDDLYVTLSLNTKGVVKEIKSRSAIVATGYGAPLARRLGLNGKMEIISGCQALVETSNIQNVEIFTGGNFGHGGFGWLVPHTKGHALSGVLTRKHSYKLMESHIHQLQKESRIGAVKSVYRCRPIPLGISDCSVLNRVIGVGDVVNQVKPTTGGGIYYGLLGADAAAETLSNALEVDDLTANALKPYETKWKSIMAAEITSGYHLRKFTEQLPDNMLEQMHKLLRVPGVKNILTSGSMPFDWHSGPLIKFINLLSRQIAR